MTTTNRLAQETSPYLRQHAGNPVDWYPWGPEAFEAAKTRDVPILLSVGYSACHWCHVMAHECFENPRLAEMMNLHFVNVKVDREERPDVDSIYMEALQLVSGSGGWPMTVLALPDGRPFFAGTYFPPERFAALISQVSSLWADKREQLEADAEALTKAVRAGTGLPAMAPSLSRSAAGTGDPAGTGDTRTDRGRAVLASAAQAVVANYDPEWGGFARAPKFPQPSMLELLLQAWWQGGSSDALEACTTTLDAMASGGIYDHLGGGFARYSTDRRWLVPHFEKMLYDNALLARVYLHAWQVTGHERYRQVVRETLGYMLRPPLRLSGGGMCSAEDADSEGEEGKFYVWDLEEVRRVGGPGAIDWYGVSEAGNWEGHNILWRPVRAELIRPPEVEAARAALFATRESRPRPGLDDKVLTEWNAMAVTALAEAGAVLGEDQWTAAAGQTAAWLLEHMRGTGGRWMRAWQATSPEGRPRHLAYAGDYAWLVEAFTRLAEASGQARWIEEARRAADSLMELFWDPETGGFFTTGSDAESLIARPKDAYDGALPSANSVAAAALARLGTLTGEASYVARAREVVEAMAPALAKAPAGFPAMAVAGDIAETTLTEVVISGTRPDLVAVAHAAYQPRSVLAWGEPYDSPLWTGREGTGLAYLCRDYSCAAPISTPADLAAALRAPALP